MFETVDIGAGELKSANLTTNLTSAQTIVSGVAGLRIKVWGVCTWTHEIQAAPSNAATCAFSGSTSGAFWIFPQPASGKSHVAMFPRPHALLPGENFTVTASGNVSQSIGFNVLYTIEP